MSITSKTKQNKTSSYSLGYYTTIVYRLYPLAALILSIIEIPYIDLEVKSGQINFQSPVVPGLLFMVFSILSYSIFFLFGILMYVLWRNDTDYYPGVP